MEDRLLTHALRFAIILVIGFTVCTVTRTRPRLAWVAAAFAMVVVHDAFLTSWYGRIPPILEGLIWNWTGKLLALGVGLGLVFLVGRRRCGLTLKQNEGSGIALSSALSLRGQPSVQG